MEARRLPRRFLLPRLGICGRANEEIDRIESAFLVRNEKAIAKGPALNFRDNYLRLGTRPMFLFGTDDWSYTFSTRRETPLQWLRDMRARRDLGVQIYENLQFGIPAPANREELLRKVDGIVQLAQEYQQVYFAGLARSATTSPPATPSWRSRLPGAATSPNATPRCPG